jgi:hypothetical protein
MKFTFLLVRRRRTRAPPLTIVVRPPFARPVPNSLSLRLSFSTPALILTAARTLVSAVAVAAVTGATVIASPRLFSVVAHLSPARPGTRTVFGVKLATTQVCARTCVTTGRNRGALTALGVKVGGAGHPEDII